MKENIIERMQRIDGKKRISDFMVKQQMPYHLKKRYAQIRIEEFARECNARELNRHVSVGGLDSICLYLFLNRMTYIGAPGISVSSLEDKSIQRIHKALGIECLKPSKRADGTYWTKASILQEFGFPVLSKEIAAKIETLANPTERNKTVRHAIVTGETGEYGGYQKNSRMKMSQKWLEKFGGYANEEEGVNYQIPNFPVSSNCCYYLKEAPCDAWARENNSVPFLGLMASEGGRRAKALMLNGCNYFGKSTIRSAPFAIFTRQDILQLALELDEAWRNCWREEYFQVGLESGRFDESFEMPESIIPEIYGTIQRKEDGTLYTTGAQRTGCSMCGFGIHLEKRPHRFDQLKERNLKEWQYWMFECCTDKNTGEKYGWARVLDYIGVGY